MYYINAQSGPAAMAVIAILVRSCAGRKLEQDRRASNPGDGLL